MFQVTIIALIIINLQIVFNKSQKILINKEKISST